MANQDYGRLQHQEYEPYPSSPSNGGSPNTNKARTTFSGESLKTIGDNCKNRLPPASAVQAMFLYELQRQTEAEKLFHGHLFKLAQQETTDAADQKRMKSLEKRLAALEKQAIHDRVEKATALLEAHEGKINTCSTRVNTVDEKLTGVNLELEKLKKQAEEATTALTAHQAAEKTAKAAAPELDPQLSIIKQELDILFLDRDGTLARIEEAKTRLTRLEENLRALTLQRAAPQAKSPGLPHRLPVTNPNGSQK